MIVANDKFAEGNKIAEEIQRRRTQLGLRYRDVAILARTRRILTSLEDILKQHSIPVYTTAITTKSLVKNREVGNLFVIEIVFLLFLGLKVD